MRILIVTHYFEPDTGAAAVRLTRLAKLLKKRGHDITVLCTMPHYPRGIITEGYRKRFSITENHDGIQVIRVWLWATPSPKISRKLISQLSFMLAAGLRGIRLWQPDVVLVEAQPIFTGLAGRWIAFIKRTPYVLNVSDLWPDHLLSVGAVSVDSVVYRAARKIVDNTYEHAARIIAMSPEWARKISGYIGRGDTVSVIYNGVDLKRFQPDLDAQAFRDNHQLGDSRIISFIGTFATQYDFELMLNVVRQFRERDDVRFVMIGTGSQRKTVENFLQTTPLPNLQLIDWIDHSEIPYAWSASYLTFWSMRDEALYHGTIPAKLYEALACGVPVVAAIKGEGAAMIEASGSGITVSPGDTSGLVDAISQLLNNPNLRVKFSQSARTYAESHLDADKVAEGYEMVFVQLGNTTH